MLDVVQVSAASGHFVQADENPFAAFFAPHIDRKRPGGGREFLTPLGKRIIASDPDFSGITFGERMPSQTDTQTEDDAVFVDDEIGREVLSA